LGAAGSLVVLDPDVLGADLSWRIAFGIGAVLGLIILYLRRFVPESPRWLLTHGRAGEANRVVADIEARIAAEQGPLPPPDRSIAVRFRSHTPIMVMLRTVVPLMLLAITCKSTTPGCRRKTG
jgi:MFS family permease